MTDHASRPMQNRPGSPGTQGHVSGSLFSRSALVVLACLLCSVAAAADGAGTLSLELGKIFTFFFLTLGPKSVIAPFASSTAALDASSRRKVALTTTGV